MLGAAGVQIPENNLDDLHSSREEDRTSENMDLQDLLGLGVSLSRAVGFLRGTSAVVVILVKGHAFPTIVKVHPVGYDLLALVDGFIPVEDKIGLLETRFDEEAVFVFGFPEDVTSSMNLTLLSLFFEVTATNLSLELLILGQTTLADNHVISLSGGDNKPPMLEKHLYDSWKSRIELYMMNRPHGRMILASIEKGPLVWPSTLWISLTTMNDMQIKFGLIMRNPIPLALVASHQITQSPYQTHQHTYQNTQLQPPASTYPSPQYGSPYQSQQYSTHQSSTPLLVTYPSNDFQSSIHHNIYSPSSSIPQLEYPPQINQQSEFSQQDSGLIVPVFQKGDDPIDAINHMMSFLTAVVTSRYPTTNNH
ncbi:hypothetical protein Tco_0657097 [Tanacetum coccineum]|uniref:Uncharacterized protein n=1 Tax=Tanacetum coccineum TaxID=301880 RepID=A0ABQ4XBD2_9ASTR